MHVDKNENKIVQVRYHTSSLTETLEENMTAYENLTIS